MSHRIVRLALLAVLSTTVSPTLAEGPKSSCVPLDARADIGDDGGAPLELIIAADTQLQSLHGGQYGLLTGPIEDRMVNVSIRPPALAVLGYHALYILLDAALRPQERTQLQPKRDKPDAVLYLGDGANNGCADEITALLTTLDHVREDHELPVFIVPGNHDYTGNGNSNDWEAREALCDRDGQADPANKPLSRAQVLEKFDVFNRQSAQKRYAARWAYTSNAETRDCPSAASPGSDRPSSNEDTHENCFMAGVVHDCGAEAGGRCTAKEAERRIWLLDTTDYHGSGCLPPENMRGMGWGVSDAQARWFTDNGGDRVPIIASHYEAAPAEWISEGTRDRRTSAPVRLWGHTHSPLPCQQRTLPLALNVGSTTDDHPHVARVHIADDGAARWDPFFLAPDQITGLEPADRIGAFEMAGRCEAFVEGLRRAALPPWRVRPVADQTSGLAIYGLDQTYRDLAWTREDEQATRHNLSSMIAWMAGQRLPDGMATFERDMAHALRPPRASDEAAADATQTPATSRPTLTSPAESIAPVADATPSSLPSAGTERGQKATDIAGQTGEAAIDATWPLEELIACLAHTAATIEGAGARPAVPFTVPIDSYRLMVRPAFAARLGQLRGSGAAGLVDPAYVGLIESRFEWRRTTAFDFDVRAARPGGDGATDWRLRLDRFTGETGSRKGEVSWRVVAGRTDLESGHGSVLGRRLWQLEPPRFDGIDARLRLWSFGVRVGAYETASAYAPSDLPQHRLLLGTVEWCPLRPTADPLVRRADVGVPARCATSRGFDIDGGVDAVGLVGADWQTLLDVGARLRLQWSDVWKKPYLRLQLEGNGQWDWGLTPDEADRAFRGAARLSGFINVVGARLELTARAESLTRAGEHDAPYRLLYGRRHRRFGGSNALVDPHRLDGEGAFHVGALRVAIHPPVEFLSFDRSLLGAEMTWLPGGGEDLAFDLELRTRTAIIGMLVGLYRFDGARAERAAIDRAGSKYLLTIGGEM